MNLYYPGNIWLLLIIIPLIVSLFFWNRREKKRFSRFANPSFYPEYLSSRSQFLHFFKYILIILALAFIIFALLRPQWDYEEREYSFNGLDIMVCLDVSKSMDAQDITPSRLLRAKMQIDSLIDKLKGDRIGIIAFAGVPTLECPLTDDYACVRLVLNSINTDNVVSYGTDIGAALALASRSFQSAGGSNILLLITDGEDLAGSAILQAKRLSSQGVKIYVLGVGSEEGTFIRDEKTGQQALTKLDTKTLQAIASIGKGKYFSVTPGQGELDPILQNIYASESGRGRSRNFSVLKDQYAIPAIIAIIILLVESLLLPLSRKRENV